MTQSGLEPKNKGLNPYDLSAGQCFQMVGLCLPERNTDPNTPLENPGQPQFSTLLTKVEISKARIDVGASVANDQMLAQMIPQANPLMPETPAGPAKVRW